MLRAGLERVEQMGKEAVMWAEACVCVAEAWFVVTEIATICTMLFPNDLYCAEPRT